MALTQISRLFCATLATSAVGDLIGYNRNVNRVISHRRGTYGVELGIPAPDAIDAIFRKGCEDNKQQVANNPVMAAICAEALSKHHVVEAANEMRRQQQREIDARKVELSKGLDRMPVRRRLLANPRVQRKEPIVIRPTMPSLRQQILNNFSLTGN